MNIALAPNLSSFFDDALASALEARKVEATDGARTYLVALLADFAHPDPRASDTFARPLTFLLDEALHATGAERFERLRTLGDAVLYVAGFFSDHIENRGVDVGYVVTVGSTAYESAGAMLRGPTSEAHENVFRELAGKFARFVDVLAEVAESSLAQQARGERGLVRLYERWLRTGSATLASELGQRGIVPVKPAGGVH